MTTELAVFNFNETPVRTVEDDHDLVWFVAKDICDALGYVNHKKAIKDHVDEEDIKGVTIRDSLGKNPQNANAVNESGMYSLILRSKKPEAKRFKRWVTAEVLPAIRKTGRYEVPKPNTLTPAQKSHIQDRVKWLVANQIGVTYQSIYGEINRQFKVGTYKEIATELYPAVCKFLGCQPMESDEIAYIAVNRDELNAVTAWFEVARHRRNQLAEAQRQLNEAVAAVRDVSINLHDPLSEPLFLLHQMVDMKQASKKANRLIQMQDKARTH